MNRLVRADAFDDLQRGPVFGGEASPGGAWRLDRIDGIDDDAMAEPQMLVRQCDRDLLGGDAGFSLGKAAAPHRRLDRIDREYRYRQMAGDAFRQRAFAGTGQAGQNDELLHGRRPAHVSTPIPCPRFPPAPAP